MILNEDRQAIQYSLLVSPVCVFQIELIILLQIIIKLTNLLKLTTNYNNAMYENNGKLPQGNKTTIYNKK